MFIARKMKVLGLCVMTIVLTACSSMQHAGTGADGFSGVQTAGLGTEGGFVNEAEMSKLLGVQKNTIYFGFDKTYVDPSYRSLLQANADYLKQHPQAKLRLEGNTDPVGSREYNIGLGQRRAFSVEQQLELLGVPRQQLVTVSYGQERPAVSGDAQDAYRLDRRVDLVYMNKG